jgi:phosphate-selective porin OprO/OprP
MHRARTLRVCIAGLGAWWIAASPAAAQPRVEMAAPAPLARSKRAVRFEWPDHPTLRIGIVSLAGRARFQVDGRRSDAPLADEDDQTLDIARRRIGVEGRVGRFVDFEIARELNVDTDPWRDVYVNYRQFAAAEVRAGKFKLPFGLDENTSATSLDFVYRSLAASVLSPGRDRGVMAHGRLLNRLVQYEIGSFEHDGRNARPGAASTRVTGDRTIAGHLSSEPFRRSKSAAADLLVGMAWTSGPLSGEGLSGIRGKTVFGDTFYAAPYPVDGHRRRVGIEARWRPGPVSVQSEYVKLSDERLGEGVEDNDLSPIDAVAWYLSGTWALTGDSKSRGLDETKHPIFRGGAGAVEVAARIERLTFRSGHADETPSTSPRAEVIVGNSSRVMTFGANWYLNRWVKIQFNLIRETLTDPGQGPLPGQPSFWSRVVRFQFAL